MRVNIREILRTPHLRKQMLVDTIIAIQAREGIETTQEQAEEAYEAASARRAELTSSRYSTYHRRTK